MELPFDGLRYEAATDAGPWRERGIPVYGLRPYRAPAKDPENMHGIDERVSFSGLDEGTDMVERSSARSQRGGQLHKRSSSSATPREALERASESESSSARDYRRVGHVHHDQRGLA